MNWAASWATLSNYSIQYQSKPLVLWVAVNLQQYKCKYRSSHDSLPAVTAVILNSYCTCTAIHGTAVCVDLATSERKAVHMNIIMCRNSYSG